MASSIPATSCGASVRKNKPVKPVCTRRTSTQPIQTSFAAPVQHQKVLQPTSVMQPAPAMQPRKVVQVVPLMQPASVAQPAATSVTQPAKVLQATSVAQPASVVQPTSFVQELPVVTSPSARCTGTSVMSSHVVQPMSSAYPRTEPMTPSATCSASPAPGGGADFMQSVSHDYGTGFQGEVFKGTFSHPSFDECDKPIIVHFTADFGTWIAVRNGIAAGLIQKIKVDTDGRQISFADDTTLFKGFRLGNTISGEVFKSLGSVLIEEMCKHRGDPAPRSNTQKSTSEEQFRSQSSPAQGGGKFRLEKVEAVKTIAYLPKEVDGKVVLQQVDKNQWKVSNDSLHDSSPGMVYRSCKTFDNLRLIGVAHAPWDSIAIGSDNGDGWISCEVVTDPLFQFKYEEGQFLRIMGMVTMSEEGKQLLGLMEAMAATSGKGKRKGKGKGKGKGKEECSLM
mmetsp:Transcript_28863/g.54096  ORF Transcript_28863/g.54096 Transcript_28863/m.54096 type:complete len:451 (-) Transcript_28863:124-1476(-)